MELNELRLGNWVKTCTPGMEVMIPYLNVKVQAIGLGGMISFRHTAATEGFEMPIHYITGIPITEIILDSLGWEQFRSGPNWSEWKLDKYRFHFRPNEDIANCFGIDTGTKAGHNIYYFNWNTKSVHQLQNIYFAAKGEELKPISKI